LNKTIEQALRTLFEQWSGTSVVRIKALPPSGSYRQYYRLVGGEVSAMGVFNEDRKENEAFLSFSRHFHQKGLAVPEVYGENLDQSVYLLQDLGNQTLFAELADSRVNGHFPDLIIQHYRRALEELVRFQVEGAEGLDYSRCYPRQHFDQQSMMWDLNYFKYYFLKLVRAPFDEQELERDFHTFSDYLMQTERSYFLYRDFQARNIMLHDGKHYFIDYQGGRQGALQYDLASILYQAKANLPAPLRESLLHHYLDTLERYKKVNRDEFVQFYYAYVLMRTVQVLGAYGFRGFYERKTHFLESIPYAVRNLEEILDKTDLPVKIPALMDTFRYIVEHEDFRQFGHIKPENASLKVNICSFSYKRGLPEDPTEHGGGYIFDCRGLHNPGRYQEYKKLTGRDPEVIRFLHEQSDVEHFLENVFGLVNNSVERYLKRGFNYLSVSFGCTGGQHRSVYCADRVAQLLERKYKVNVVLHHREQERKNWIN
jgi:aminoglycoside/choline kinase family phosphotransferase